MSSEHSYSFAVGDAGRCQYGTVPGPAGLPQRTKGEDLLLSTSLDAGIHHSVVTPQGGLLRFCSSVGRTARGSGWQSSWRSSLTKVTLILSPLGSSTRRGARVREARQRLRGVLASGIDAADLDPTLDCAAWPYALRAFDFGRIAGRVYMIIGSGSARAVSMCCRISPTRAADRCHFLQLSRWRPLRTPGRPSPARDWPSTSYWPRCGPGTLPAAAHRCSVTHIPGDS